MARTKRPATHINGPLSKRQKQNDGSAKEIMSRESKRIAAMEPEEKALNDARRARNEAFGRKFRPVTKTAEWQNMSKQEQQKMRESARNEFLAEYDAK